MSCQSNKVHWENLGSSHGVFLESLNKPSLSGQSHSPPGKVFSTLQHLRGDGYLTTATVCDVNCDRVTCRNVMNNPDLSLRQLLCFQIDSDPKQSLWVNNQLLGFVYLVAQMVSDFTRICLIPNRALTKTNLLRGFKNSVLYPTNVLAECGS